MQKEQPMIHKIGRSIVGLTMVALVALVAGTAASAIAADSYKVDPAHASVVFRIKHLTSSFVYGRFDKIAGTFDVDEADPTGIKFDVTIQAASIDTNQPRRDDDLRGPDFFDVKEYPTLTFKSKSVTKTGDNKYDVTGDMTIRGVTKEITVPMEFVGTANMMGQRAGWATEFVIKRSEYGVKKDPGAVGEEVKIMMSFEGTKS